MHAYIISAFLGVIDQNKKLVLEPEGVDLFVVCFLVNLLTKSKKRRANAIFRLDQSCKYFPTHNEFTGEHMSNFF